MLPHVGAGLVPALVSIYHSGHPQEMPLRISARLPPLTEKQDHRLATEDYRLKCYLGNASVNESSFYFLPLAQIGSPWHFCHYLTCPPPKKMPPRVIGGSAYNALRYFCKCLAGRDRCASVGTRHALSFNKNTKKNNIIRDNRFVQISTIYTSTRHYFIEDKACLVPTFPELY